MARVCSGLIGKLVMQRFASRRMRGLEFDPEGRRILLVNPCLPPFASKVIIRNLTFGDISVDFAARQHSDAVSLQVLPATCTPRLSSMRICSRRRA